MATKPGLFGLKYSNRDFSLPESWGKNQFNSSFPAALLAFMEHKGLKNIYLKLGTDAKVVHSTISTPDLLGMTTLKDDLFFAFESEFTPYKQLVLGRLPRVDLVTQTRSTKTCLKGLEVKLTALPDNTTCNLKEEKFGSEIVIRPDTIIYLACSIVQHFSKKPAELCAFWGATFDNLNWEKADDVLPLVPKMVGAVNALSSSMLEHQEPILVQPIWKTKGKSPNLADQCLDVFVWSNLAFCRLFVDIASKEARNPRISRQVRSLVWLMKMLYDFAISGQFHHANIIDSLSFNTKNDKAFAVSGTVTNPYMACAALSSPRVAKHEIKEIILGGGQDLLSPERRFDAIIFNSPDLFR